MGKLKKFSLGLILIALFLTLSVAATVHATGGNVTITAVADPLCVAYDSGKGEVFVTNQAYNGNYVSVISDATNAVVASIPVGASPWGMAYDSGNGELYVANDGAQTVSVISDSSNSVVATIPVEDHPFGVAYDSGKGEIFEANFDSGTVSVISDSSNSVVATISVGMFPSWVAYDPSLNEMFVTHSGSNTVSVISDRSNTVIETISVGDEPFGIAYDSASSEMFVANEGSNSVSVISDSTNTVVATIPVGNYPEGIAYDSSIGEIFVTNYKDGTVSIISDGTNAVIATVPVGNCPVGVAYDLGKSEIFIANWRSDSVSVINVSGTVPLPSPTLAPSSSSTPSSTSSANPEGTSGSWVTKAPMPAAAGEGGCAVVNGIIYVIGDTFNYAYNPTTDTWSSMTAMPTPRDSFAVAACGNKIYIIGGTEDASGSTCSVNEVYDPATNSWATAASMPTARSEMNAATADGKIYVMGGRTAGAYSTVNVTEIYDPSTNSWTTGAPLLYPVVAYASAVVNNKIYVIGGQDELFGFNGFVPFGEPAPNPTPNINVQFTQIYNPATNSWSLGASIPATAFGSEAGATTGILAPAQIYVFGGVAGFGIASNQNWAYDPATNSWSSEAALPNATSSPAVAVVNDLIYVIGTTSNSSDFYAVPTFSSNWQYTPIGYSTPSLTPMPTFSPSNATVQSGTCTTIITNNSATIDMYSTTGVSITIYGSLLQDGTQINVTSTYYGGNQPLRTGIVSLNKAAFYDICVTLSSGTLSSDVYANVTISNPNFTNASVIEYWNGNGWVSISTMFSQLNMVSGTISASALTGTPIVVGILKTDNSAKSNLLDLIIGAMAGIAAAAIAITVLRFAMENRKRKTAGF
jgi:YVTN family beta-propeller protein